MVVIEGTPGLLYSHSAGLEEVMVVLKGTYYSVCLPSLKRTDMIYIPLR